MLNLKISLPKPTLIAQPENGYAYYPVDYYLRVNGKTEEDVYNEDYFNKYSTYENENFTNPINDFRSSLVRKYIHDGGIVDVGIGSGTFVRELNCSGYDINPAGIEWLKEREAFFDIYNDDIDEAGVKAMTFFDSFEHIPTPFDIIFPEWVFVSIPIYPHDGFTEAVLSSKHFRRDEHFHYFTLDCFVQSFKEIGYKLVEYSNMESVLGRDQIGTFVFRLDNA